jgi:hypothetical protein
MKTPALLLLALLSGSATLSAQSTINSTNRYAYAANLGWVDARGDTTNGVVVGEYVCSGFAYGANVGWINFGSGTAANGVYYSNTTGTDFGINQDGTGRLRGYAYGANIGWINFEDTGNPTVDLITGLLSGYAYSANCGWINLGQFTPAVVVVTDTIRRGFSSSADGIPDAWKILNFGSVLNPNAAGNLDPDGDGITNRQEYLDGTNPNNPNSGLKIVTFTKTGSALSVTWNSVPTGGFTYTIEKNPDLLGAWTDSGQGVITPSGGPTTSRGLSDLNTQQFYRVRSFQTALLQPPLP